MKTLSMFVFGASAVLLSGSVSFGQTNIATNAPETAAAQATDTPPPPFVIKSADGICDITIDTSGAPDLKQWAETTLAHALSEWFPKIIAELPVEGYTPPTRFSVMIGPANTQVAATSGTRVTANAVWFRGQLNGEAVGALIHEEVHVIQLYRGGVGRGTQGGAATNSATTNAVAGGRRGNQAGRLAPWLVEAIPDYIRWFKFEPQSHGADDVWLERQARRNLPASFNNIRYDAPYRPGANFLNWVAVNYDKGIVAKLNAAARQGKYGDDIWKENCRGKTPAELGNEWKMQLAKKFNIEWSPPSATNSPAASPVSNTTTNK